MRLWSSWLDFVAVWNSGEKQRRCLHTRKNHVQESVEETAEIGSSKSLFCRKQWGTSARAHLAFHILWLWEEL